jgi:hypothetical protein
VKETTVTFSRIWSVSSVRRSHAYGAVGPDLFAKKKKLQLFYSRPTAIISLKQNFSPHLKRVFKGREFYSAQEKRKIAEMLSNFF